MFLNYFSLAILVMGLTLVFYGFIYIHDIPYEIAKHRNHPHAESIHVACWLSLFTLHAIWPIVYIWAIKGSKPFEVKVIGDDGVSIDELQNRIAALEQRLKLTEAGQSIAQPKEIVQ